MVCQTVCSKSQLAAVLSKHGPGPCSYFLSLTGPGDVGRRRGDESLNGQNLMRKVLYTVRGGGERSGGEREKEA